MDNGWKAILMLLFWLYWSMLMGFLLFENVFPGHAGNIWFRALLATVCIWWFVAAFNLLRRV